MILDEKPLRDHWTKRRQLLLKILQKNISSLCKTKSWVITETGHCVLFDLRVEIYQDLKRVIGRMWGITKVQVVFVIIGALGSVTKGFHKWIEKLDIPCNVVDMQKTAL